MQTALALIRFIFGVLFALIGVFTMMRTFAFLCAAPQDHLAMVAWAFIIMLIGFYLLIRGLGYAYRGASRFQGPKIPGSS